MVEKAEEILDLIRDNICADRKVNCDRRFENLETKVDKMYYFQVAGLVGIITLLLKAFF